jgi:hypothetical protein
LGISSWDVTSFVGAGAEPSCGGCRNELTLTVWQSPVHWLSARAQGRGTEDFEFARERSQTHGSFCGHRAGVCGHLWLVSTRSSSLVWRDDGRWRGARWRKKRMLVLSRACLRDSEGRGGEGRKQHVHRLGLVMTDGVQTVDVASSN